jgi:hypothetical protein
MRILLLIFIYIAFTQSTFAQKISYDIPEGYQKVISKPDYKKIVEIVVPTIANRFSIDFVKDGAVHLKTGEIFNLHNLIRKCVAVQDKSLWKEVIQEHFNNIFSSLDEQKNIDPNNFESVKKYLSLRIYPEKTVAMFGGVSNLVAKIDLEGTYTLLMLDLPGAFTAVQQKMFAVWKLDTATVFKIAQDNINKHPVEKLTQKFEMDGSEIELSFIGEENYAASYALDLSSNSPELIGEWGSVVAVPNKGLVNICKVSKNNPVDFVKFIQFTRSTVEQYFQEHDQPISTQYFWYYKGKFTKISVVTDASGNINVVSPMGLTELMTEKN